MRVHAIIALSLSLAACTPPTPEVEGLWTDDFGTLHSIDRYAWTMEGDGWSSVFHVLSLDNRAGWLVAHNDEANDYNPDLYSRFDWTWGDDGDLWYCQSVFDAASIEDAEAAPAPDASDPASGGCGGFAWSLLTPVE